MPRQVWIVLAALAAASPSFAKDAAPKSAVHSWSEAVESTEPVVMPVGKGAVKPQNAFAGDFPDIGAPAQPAPPAPARPTAAAKPAAAAAKPSAVAVPKAAPAVPSKAATSNAVEAASKPAPVPTVAPMKPSVAVPAQAAAAPMPPQNIFAAFPTLDQAPQPVPKTIEVPQEAKAPTPKRVDVAPQDPAADSASGELKQAKGIPSIATSQEAPAVVESPYGAPLPAVVEPSPGDGGAPAVAPEIADVVPLANPAPAVVEAPPPVPKVIDVRAVFGGKDVKVASGNLPEPKIIEVPDPQKIDIPEAPAVIRPKIINVSTSRPSNDYGAPLHKTADREELMREFPDSLVEQLWLQDWQDIERAYQFGRLVEVPSDPDGRGIVLRLEGASRIGQLEDDAYKQTLLCRLAKPALGLLYRIAARMKAMEGEDYVPLEITSLVRTWDYQLRLADVNPNADRTRDGVPPTHVLGLAFDIARTQMSFERQQRIEFLFDELARGGELAYYKEGSTNGLMHYHVMALPSAETQLVRAYEQNEYRASSGRYEQRDFPAERPRASDSPCVTFGSSLEPFSAICSCELPLEVSASGFVADAPISH